MKKILVFVTLTLLLSDCKKPEDTMPCYIGTFTDIPLSCPTQQILSNTLILNSSGIGSVIMDQCAFPQTVVVFSYEVQDGILIIKEGISITTGGSQGSFSTYTSRGFPIPGIRKIPNNFLVDCVSTGLKLTNAPFESKQTLWTKK
jgi:hypothetical protein